MNSYINKADTADETDTLVVEMTIRFFADATAYIASDVKNHVSELLHRRCMFDVEVDVQADCPADVTDTCECHETEE